MTSIACWFNKECSDSIWMCGDTRISQNQGGSSITLIDSGAKLFGIPMVCRKADENGFFNQIFHVNTFGMAYAGNSLVGLNLQAALTTILLNLCSDGSFDGIPSMAEISDFTGNLVQDYTQSLAVQRGESAACELAICGFCQKNKDFFIGHLKTQPSPTGFAIEKEYYLSKSTGLEQILLLGCDQPRIKDRILQVRKSAKDGGIQFWRAPKAVLEELIDSHDNPSIGGSLQLGIVDKGGYKPYSVCKPISGQRPRAFLSYLGFDVTGEYKQVGNCFVGITGMA